MKKEQLNKFSDILTQANEKNLECYFQLETNGSIDKQTISDLINLLDYARYIAAGEK